MNISHTTVAYKAQFITVKSISGLKFSTHLDQKSIMCITFQGYISVVPYDPLPQSDTLSKFKLVPAVLSNPNLPPLLTL